jgi:hypothetical protein
MTYPNNPATGTEYETPDGRLYRWAAKGKWAKASSAIPAAATPQEISEGIVANKYISPATFPFIRVNTTLNVPGDYATIGDALTYLKAFRIPADVSVTIQLGTGSYPAPINCAGHPDAGQITLAGAPMLGAMPVDADFTMSVAGSGFQTSAGINADRATTETMLRGRFASIVTFLNGGGFSFRGGLGFGTIRQIMILGGGAITDAGIGVSYGSFLSLDRVSVHNCNKGVAMIRGGQIEVVNNGLTISGCRDDGASIYSQSSFAAGGAVFFGNIGHGLVVGNNGYAAFTGGSCRGNLAAGAKAYTAGVIAAPSAKFERNATNGIRAEDSSTINMNGGGARNNGATDVAATNNSFISVNNPLYGTTTYAPTINEQGSSSNGFAVIAN